MPLKVVDKNVIDNTETPVSKCLNKKDSVGARDIREDLLERAEEYLDAGDCLILGVILNPASTYGTSRATTLKMQKGWQDGFPTNRNRYQTMRNQQTSMRRLTRY